MAELVTADVVRTDWLGMGSSDTALDATITRWIRQASDLVEALAGQPIESRSIPYTFAGDGTDDRSSAPYHVLPYWPVTALTALAYRSTDGDVALTLSDYPLRPLGGAYRIVGAFSRHLEYVATLTVGYSPNAIPEPLVRVCCEMVAQIARSSSVKLVGRDRLGVQAVSESAPNVATKTLTLKDLRPEWLETIKLYAVAQTV